MEQGMEPFDGARGGVVRTSTIILSTIACSRQGRWQVKLAHLPDGVGVYARRTVDTAAL